jgi:hypothetical protein
MIKSTIINNINNIQKFDPTLTKKILCFAMLGGKDCQYGSKCRFAHSLEEQKIEPIRHKVYTILRNKTDLSDLDLVHDEKLFNALHDLTKICSLCAKKTCCGGYNCRHGAINQHYRVCFEDLMYGYCKKMNCNSIHLTERQLVPYNQQKMKLHYKSDLFSTTDSCDSSYTKKTKNNYRKVWPKKKYLHDIQGVLLTEQFLINRFDKKNDMITIPSSSDDEDEVQKMIEYLNTDDDSYNDLSESIFD